MLACSYIYITYYANEAIGSFPYQLLLALISTILLTVSLRRFFLKKLANKLRSNFSFELLLATWCILLVMIHLECQLLFLMLFQAPLILPVAGSIIVFGFLVILLTWPKLEKIQALLKD